MAFTLCHTSCWDNEPAVVLVPEAGAVDPNEKEPDSAAPDAGAAEPNTEGKDGAATETGTTGPNEKELVDEAVPDAGTVGANTEENDGSPDVGAASNALDENKLTGAN